jgi:hypothetical protein
MKPIATYGGDPTILALVSFGSGLALMAVNGRSEFMVLRTSRFVFAFPTRRALAPVETPIQIKQRRAPVLVPIAGTRLIAAPCRTCSGMGRALGLFRCRGCNGEGEKTLCPEFPHSPARNLTRGPRCQPVMRRRHNQGFDEKREKNVRVWTRIRSA